MRMFDEEEYKIMVGFRPKFNMKGKSVCVHKKRARESKRGMGQHMS